VTWQACRYLISPCVFNNGRRWPWLVDHKDGRVS